MDKKTESLIYQFMHGYWKKGRKCNYKQKQMKRLVQILNDIFENEITVRSDVQRIRPKHITRYYQRTCNEAQKTRLEKYSVLEKFFSLYNPKIRVPKPQNHQLIKEQSRWKKPDYSN